MSLKSTNFGDFRPSPLVQNICVVLVEPRDGRNIGAIARAMSNLGFFRLRLVNPAAFDERIARGVACWGESVLDTSERFAALRDAVADMHEIVGFASDSGSHRVPQRLLEEWVSSIDVAAGREIALVFGSEENGLGREHFPLCQHLVRIPSAGDNRSFNLAQSVLLALYVLRGAHGTAVGEDLVEWPTSNQLDAFTQMVLRVSERVGFLNEHSPPHIRDLLTNVTRRGRLSTRELKIMTGMFGRIEKALKGEVPLNDKIPEEGF